jgi:hypothetical protein
VPHRSHHFAAFIGDQWGMLFASQVCRLADGLAARAGAGKGAPLSEQDAIDIWIARWLRVPRKDILLRYGCDPRRLYEIWEQQRFVGSRDKALACFRARYPGLTDRVDFGPHRRVLRRPPPDLQPSLFEESSVPRPRRELRR